MSFYGWVDLIDSVKLYHLGSFSKEDTSEV